MVHNSAVWLILNCLFDWIQLENSLGLLLKNLLIVNCIKHIDNERNLILFSRFYFAAEMKRDRFLRILLSGNKFYLKRAFLTFN